MPKDYHFKSDARTDRAISVIKDSTGATISSIARRAIVAYAEWIQPIEPKKKRKP